MGSPRRIAPMTTATLVRTILFLAGLAVLIALFVALDVGEILRLIARTGWALLLIALAYAGCQASRAAALWQCQPQSRRAGYLDVLGVRVSAEAVRLLTFTGPVFSEPSKVWLLRRRGLQVTEGVATIVAELLTHSAVATLLSIGAFTFLIVNVELGPATRTALGWLVLALAGYVLLIVLAVSFRVYLIGAAVGWLGRLGVPGTQYGREQVREMEDLLLQVLRERPAQLAAVVGAQVAANAFLVLEIHLALSGMGIDAPTFYAAVIEGSVKLVSVTFFFVPTQVGVSEGAYAFLFDALGVSAAAGVSLALIRRLRTLATAAVGLGIMGTLSQPARH